MRLSDTRYLISIFKEFNLLWKYQSLFLRTEQLVEIFKRALISPDTCTK